MKTHNTHNQKGFTLVETLVSLGIFVAVMTVSVSSLVIVNNAALRAQQMRVLLDNINFAMDSMVRTIRTAESVSCGKTRTAGDCPQGSGKKGTSLYVGSTLGNTNEDLTYFLEGGIIKKHIGSNTYSVDMTSTDITISKLDFYVTGTEDSGTTQPLVRIFISGVATTKGGQTSPFAFQTAVTPRAPGL